MTVIRPNSVSGINSITAQANEIKIFKSDGTQGGLVIGCLLYTSPSPRDNKASRMPSSA